jgi:hypothetical protein
MKRCGIRLRLVHPGQARTLQLCCLVGQPILAAAAFQAALSHYERAFVPGKGRLKAGCRQNCLPHPGAA